MWDSLHSYDAFGSFVCRDIERLQLTVISCCPIPFLGTSVFYRRLYICSVRGSGVICRRGLWFAPLMLCYLYKYGVRGVWHESHIR